jgi:SAM-dependent methyltransferase
MIADWPAFWDSPHSIYVNARHKDVHYRLIANQVTALVPSTSARVLDYGSGEALHAGIVAAAAGALILSEAAPGVRAGLQTRFAGNPKIRVLAPDEVAQLPEQGLDVVVLHSVTQYLTPDEAQALFVLFHQLLKPTGVLIVGDILPPHVPAATDAFALLRFGAANGFFMAALLGLLRTLLSDYWRLRSRLGLTRYAEIDMIDKLHAAGFAARRSPVNLGHNRARMAFRASPIISPSPGDDAAAA